jgi:hypothetical protein
MTTAGLMQVSRAVEPDIHCSDPNPPILLGNRTAGAGRSRGRTEGDVGLCQGPPPPIDREDVIAVTARLVSVGTVLRYARGVDHASPTVDGYPNFFHVTAAPSVNRTMLTLERGISPAAEVFGPDARRRPVILIRSSPWKAGQASNPWHDEFDIDHGRVRYFGDHKPETDGLPGATTGNRALMDAWYFHAASSGAERLLAPPLVLFRSKTVRRGDQTLVKGHVEFLGASLIERIEYVVQRDPLTGISFPNVVLDLAILDLRESADALDMRWIDDRRDEALDAETTLRYAPASWKRWVEQGAAAIPAVRRRVPATRIKSSFDQQPAPGSADDEVLHRVCRYFDGREHLFKLLAARVAARVLGSGGAAYTEGWMTRAGGDDDLDFVGRLDVGIPEANTQLVVLGQAKFVEPGSVISAETVARVVARLQRGRIGVFVTTGAFAERAQAEIIGDRHPLVMIDGRMVAEQVAAMAATDHSGDVDALLDTVSNDYANAVTYRQPEEILLP